MSDQIPNAEQQIPSVEQIFKELEGRPPEEQVPVLAAILQAILGQMQDIDGRLSQVCEDHHALDSEFHDKIWNPIQEGWKAKARGQGIDGIKSKYGSKFDPIMEPMAGLGVEDVYGKLYDFLEELKKESGDGWTDEQEGPAVETQYQMAMDRIGKVRGKAPESAETATDSKEPSVAVAIEEKKPEEKPKEEPKAAGKSLQEKKRSMRGGY
jgi:hypothetical protein